MRIPIFVNLGLGQEKEYFIEQLSMLLASGMPVVIALSAIKKEIKSHRLQKVISDVSIAIEAGSTISSALESASMFPASTISLIKIGEQSGRLSENLKVVAAQQQKDREFRSKTSSAMMYPLFVFSLTIIVGLGIAWFILPRLASVFAQLRIALPLITRLLIQLGIFLGHYGAIVIPAVFVGALLVLFFLFIFSKTNFLGQAILFAIPPIARLFTELELSRFGSLLGNLLEAGLPLLDSLDSLTQSSTFYRYKKLYGHLHDRIAEGNSFEKSFDLYRNVNRLIPVPIQQLVVTSEQSGNLPEMFKRIGDMYEAKTETTAKNITVMLEPILLVIVWLGVVAVALAVILPLYSLIGNLNATSSPPVPKVIQVETTATSSAGLKKEKVATQSAVKKLKILTTTTGYLNVRTEPSLTAGIIKQLKPEETFPYTVLEKNWYKIEYDVNSFGWVFGDYVEEIKP